MHILSETGLGSSLVIGIGLAYIIGSLIVKPWIDDIRDAAEHAANDARHETEI